MGRTVPLVSFNAGLLPYGERAAGLHVRPLPWHGTGAVEDSTLWWEVGSFVGGAFTPWRDDVQEETHTEVRAVPNCRTHTRAK